MKTGWMALIFQQRVPKHMYLNFQNMHSIQLFMHILEVLYFLRGSSAVFLFRLLFEQHISQCFQQYRSIINALHADAGAAAADGPVRGVAVNMAVEVGVGHAPADV